MEDELFETVYQWLRRLRPGRQGRVIYSDRVILAVHFWAVVNDKPIQWACTTDHRPRGHEDDRWPSPSRMSRRMNTPTVLKLMNELLSYLITLQSFSVMLGTYLIDAKPLRVNDYSKDRQAGWGWGCRTKAKGYKLFWLTDGAGNLVAWRLGKMNDDERTIGRRLIKSAPMPGYLIGDKKYDANPFYLAAEKLGLQMIAPRSRPNTGVSNRGCCDSRSRAIDLLESGLHPIARPLYNLRTTIERKASTFCCRTHGLKDLPTWIRTYRRVHRWVSGKLIVNLLVDQKQRLTA